MTKILQQNGQDVYNIITYLTDTEKDREDLKVNKYPMGTKVYVIETKKWYILNSSKEWKPYAAKEGESSNSENSVSIPEPQATDKNKILIVNSNGEYELTQDTHSRIFITNSDTTNNTFTPAYTVSQLEAVYAACPQGADRKPIIVEIRPCGYSSGGEQVLIGYITKNSNLSILNKIQIKGFIYLPEISNPGTNNPQITSLSKTVYLDITLNFNKDTGKYIPESSINNVFLF